MTARQAIEHIRTAMHEAVKDLHDAAYLEVLEAIQEDCRAGHEAKCEEIEDADE